MVGISAVDGHPGPDGVHDERCDDLAVSRRLQQGAGPLRVPFRRQPVTPRHGDAASLRHGHHRRPAGSSPGRHGILERRVRSVHIAEQQVPGPEEPQGVGSPRASRSLQGRSKLGIREHVPWPAPAHDRPEHRSLRFEGGRSIAGRSVEGGALRDVRHALRGVLPPVEEMDPAGDDGERGEAREGPRVESLQPSVERARLASVEGGQRRRRDEPRGGIPIAARERMLDGEVGVAGGGIPRRGLAVEPGCRSRFPPLQVCLQVVAKQVVVPVRGAVVAHLLDQEVVARERAESLPDLRQPTDGLGDRRRDRLQDGGPRQEPYVALIEVLLDLGPEVRGDVRIAAGDVSLRSGSRIAPFPGERGEVDPCRPPLGPRREFTDLAATHRVPGRGHQCTGLSLVQGQGRRSDLQQVALGPQPREGQVRLHPPRDRDPEPGRQVVEQRSHDVQRRPVAETVDVVEHDHGRFSPVVELRHESGHGGREDPMSWCGERGLDRGVERLDPVQGDGEIGEQDGRVVVVVVERQPGDGPQLPCRPLGEEGGLPIPGRGDQRDDPRRRRVREQVEEPRPGDGTRMRRRRMELGLDHWNCGTEPGDGLGQHARPAGSARHWRRWVNDVGTSRSGSRWSTGTPSYGAGSKLSRGLATLRQMRSRWGRSGVRVTPFHYALPLQPPSGSTSTPGRTRPPRAHRPAPAPPRAPARARPARAADPHPPPRPPARRRPPAPPAGEGPARAGGVQPGRAARNPQMPIRTAFASPPAGRREGRERGSVRDPRQMLGGSRIWGRGGGVCQSGRHLGFLGGRGGCGPGRGCGRGGSAGGRRVRGRRGRGSEARGCGEAAGAPARARRRRGRGGERPVGGGRTPDDTPAATLPPGRTKQTIPGTVAVDRLLR